MIVWDITYIGIDFKLVLIIHLFLEITDTNFKSIKDAAKAKGSHITNSVAIKLES